MSKPTLELSVHQLVDFLLRAGDIDDRVYNQETMQMGSKLHSAYQAEQGNSYLVEVGLAETVEREEAYIALNGRADGIIVGGRFPIIDEIKSTVAPLESFFEEQKEWHLGQALCYAFMYLHREGGEKAGIDLTYISQIDGGKMQKSFVFTRKEIEEKVLGYMDDYLAYMKLRFAHEQERDASLQGLDFPYPNFRKGQRDLAKYAFGVAKKGGVFFAEAPTGIGKTMSTLFPFVKCLKKGVNDKVFYLTAKSTGGFAAYDSLTQLYEKGFKGYDSFLVSKEKICFCPGHRCNPDDCPFAKGYYTKIKDVIQQALSEKRRFDQVTVIELAKGNGICPFELQLDLSLYADVIIGDYNYFFDPIVKLDRYFGDMATPGRYLALIDEAHNLVDRGRDMYSIRLHSANLHYAKKEMKGKLFASLKRAMKKIEAAFDELAPEGSNNVRVLHAPPLEFEKALASLKRAKDKFDKESKGARLPEDYREFSRAANRYLRLVHDYFGSNYSIYVGKEGDFLSLNLICLDPSSYLADSIHELKGATFFSATLSPIDYYMDAIIGDVKSPCLLLPSPFPKENFHLMIAPKVSVRYKDRAGSYEDVAKYLRSFVLARPGNYFLFFPSYEYLDAVTPFLDFGDADVHVQERSMGNEERSAFLANFPLHPSGTNVGLLILGGAFSEGIDMVEDRLIGVAIVGVGLPQMGFENNLFRAFFDKKLGQGFDFAYKYPGMNKVMQAVGRLIRSETDVGAALFLDDRYMKEEYRGLFQRTYQDYEVVTSPEEVEENLKSFYNKKRT